MTLRTVPFFTWLPLAVLAQVLNQPHVPFVLYLVSSEVQSLGECDVIKQKFGHSFQFSVLAVLSRLHQSMSPEKEKIATEIEGIEKKTGKMFMIFLIRKPIKGPESFHISFSLSQLSIKTDHMFSFLARIYLFVIFTVCRLVQWHLPSKLFPRHKQTRNGNSPKKHGRTQYEYLLFLSYIFYVL